MKHWWDKQPTWKGDEGSKVPSLPWKPLSDALFPHCRHRRGWHHPWISVLWSSKSYDWLANRKGPQSTSTYRDLANASNRHENKLHQMNCRSGEENQRCLTTSNWSKQQEGEDMAGVGPTAISQIRKHLFRKRLWKISQNEEVGSCHWPKSQRTYIYWLSCLPTLTKRKRRTKGVPRWKPMIAQNPLLQFPIC